MEARREEVEARREEVRGKREEGLEMRKIARGFRCAATVAAALLGVASARAELIEYRDADGTIKSADCTIVDGNTATLGNGWYAVRGKVTRGSITVTGTTGSGANLILCDGAELTVNGGDKAGIELSLGNALAIYGQAAGIGKLVANGGNYSAGIGLSRGQNVSTAGKLDIVGGIVVANGDGSAAGIGGANRFGAGVWADYGNGGEVTIRGGQVTATGGSTEGEDKDEYCYPGAGIGGAGYGQGGIVSIQGGTVVATGGVQAQLVHPGYYYYRYRYGWGIGWGMDIDRLGKENVLSLTIVGGSVQATLPGGFNAGRQCVTVDCSGMSGPLKIAGADYCSSDLYPDGDGKVYPWLPDGDHKFTLSDAATNDLYHVNVNGQPATAELMRKIPNVGLRVDDMDVGQCFGDGWAYDDENGILNLNGAGPYRITGSAGSNAPQIEINVDRTTVVLEDVTLNANNRPALVVKSGVNATLQMKGASALKSTGDSSAMAIDGTLAVDLASDADVVQTVVQPRVDVTGGSAAVSGSGRLFVSGGTFCAQAVGPAIASGAFDFGKGEVLKTGADSESASYALEHGGKRCVLVAPAVTVRVPTSVDNVRDIVVSNRFERLYSTSAGGTDYRVMRGEDVFVGYAAADDMYLVTGENPVCKTNVTSNTEVKADDFKVSAVLPLDDGHHYLESTATGRQWIDTGYHPKQTTRIEADFHSMTQSGEWTAFFGVTGDAEDSKHGLLLRYFSDSRINGWFYNDSYGEACKDGLENTRILAKLKSGEMELNDETVGISTNPANAPYDGSIYLFCENLGGKAERHQAMRLYSFKIWDVVDGVERQVRDLVPFVTADGAVCGLFDQVEKRTYLNRGATAFEHDDDSGIRYRDWDEETREMRDRFCARAIPVTADTDVLEDGNWYYVSNTVSRGMITVNGMAHLILCDGAKLTVTGGTNEAGIAVSVGNSLTIYGQTLGTGELVAKNIWGGPAGHSGACIGGKNGSSCGTVTINGGVITAKSAAWSAGIGGGSGGAGGVVTINGGKVFARAGYAAGIGGGLWSAGGTVTINGGTVEASHGYMATDIGGGYYNNRTLAPGATVTINGGNVKAATIQNAPVNGAGAAVYCVTVTCPVPRDVCRVEGLGNYGIWDIRPIDGKVYLWLPNGAHVFSVDGNRFVANVNGAAVEACRRLDYIESTGAEYIDTRYRPSVDTRLVAEILPFANAGGNPVFFGVTKGGDSSNGILLRYSDPGSKSVNAWFCNAASDEAQIADLENTRFTADLRKGKLTANGTTAGITTTGTPYGGPIYLFCGNRGGIPWQPQAMRLYSFKIYEGETLVRDFVPSIGAGEWKDKAGLYDLVEGRFYPNASGIGAFRPGYEYALPSGCRQLDYIESTGREFIDTEYTAVAGTRVELDMYLHGRSEQRDTWGVPFGTRTTGEPWTVKSFSFQMADGILRGDSFRFAYNGRFVNGGNRPFPYGERITLTCDGQHVEWTGSTADAVSFSASPLQRSKSSLYIFADNSVSEDGAKHKTGWNPCRMRLYSFKIYEGEALKHHFVPCWNEGKGAAGLYDLVDCEFHGNGGSGTFIVPPTVVESEWDFKQITDGGVMVNRHFPSAENVRVPTRHGDRSVTAIGVRAFAADPVLQRVIVPDGVTLIGEEAFANNPNLVAVRLPASATKVATNAFVNCMNLRTIVLSGAIPDPGADSDLPADCRVYWYEDNPPSTWAGRAVLKPNRLDWFEEKSSDDVTVEVKRQYTQIEGNLILPPFLFDRFVVGFDAMESGCGKVNEVILPEGLTNIAEFTFVESALTNVVVPRSVKSIGENAFRYSTNLSQLTLHEGLETIGNRAFEGTALAEVEIPRSIRYLGSFFVSADKIKSLTFLGAVPEGDDSNVFFGILGFDKSLVGSVGRRTERMRRSQLAGWRLVDLALHPLYKEIVKADPGKWLWFTGDEGGAEFEDGGKWKYLCGANTNDATVAVTGENQTTVVLCGLDLALATGEGPALRIGAEADDEDDETGANCRLMVVGENRLSGAGGGIRVNADSTLAICRTTDAGVPDLALLTVAGLGASPALEVFGRVTVDNVELNLVGADPVALHEGGAILLGTNAVARQNGVEFGRIRVPWGRAVSPDEVTVEGFGAYGVRQGRSNSEIELYVPVSGHYFTVTAGGTTKTYAALLTEGAETTVATEVKLEPPTSGQMTVNGVALGTNDLDYVVSQGWSYANGVLNLVGDGEYVLSGVNFIADTKSFVRIEVSADAPTLVLSNLVADVSATGGASAISFTGSFQTSEVRLYGENQLVGSAAGMAVPSGAYVWITPHEAAEDVPSLEAIGGTGAGIGVDGNGDGAGLVVISGVAVRAAGRPGLGGTRDEPGEMIAALDGASVSVLSASAEDISASAVMVENASLLTLRDQIVTDDLVVLDGEGGELYPVLIELPDELADSPSVRVTGGGIDGWFRPEFGCLCFWLKPGRYSFQIETAGYEAVVFEEGGFARITRNDDVTGTYVNGVDVGTADTHLLPNGVSYDPTSRKLTIGLDADPTNVLSGGVEGRLVAIETENGGGATASNLRAQSLRINRSVILLRISGSNAIERITGVGLNVEPVSGDELATLDAEAANGMVWIRGGLVRMDFQWPNENVVVSDGTLVATGLGEQSNLSAEIGGGNVTFGDGRPTRVDFLSAYRPAWKVAVNLATNVALGTHLELTDFRGVGGVAATSYGGKDIYVTEPGLVNLWLPDGDYSFKLGGRRFTAHVDGADTLALPGNDDPLQIWGRSFDSDIAVSNGTVFVLASNAWYGVERESGGKVPYDIVLPLGTELEVWGGLADGARVIVLDAAGNVVEHDRLAPDWRTDSDGLTVLLPVLEGSEERGGESEEGEGDEVKYAKVLGIEVAETVKVTVRAKKDFAYYLVRVTFEGGELVEDSTAGYGYAEDDALTLEDENPPAGSCFYVVEEFEL